MYPPTPGGGGHLHKLCAIPIGKSQKRFSALYLKLQHASQVFGPTGHIQDS